MTNEGCLYPTSANRECPFYGSPVATRKLRLSGKLRFSAPPSLLKAEKLLFARARARRLKKAARLLAADILGE